MYKENDKVYIVSDNGRKKPGKVVSSPEFEDGEMKYLCEFGSIQTYVSESRLNKLNFTILNGGR